jgi:uncharacterized damage-inducible protein DinB
MQIQNLDVFLDYYDKVHQRTMRVVRCIPPDKLDWSFREGKFTLGDLLRHMAAIERNMFAETVAGRPSRYDGCGKELADGYENVSRSSLASATMNSIANVRPRKVLPSRFGNGCVR